MKQFKEVTASALTPSPYTLSRGKGHRGQGTHGTILAITQVSSERTSGVKGAAGVGGSAYL